MQLITQTIRNAENINSPASGASGSLLSLKMANPAKDPTNFDILGGVIRIREGVGQAIPLTSQRVIASGLNFQNLSRNNTPGTIRVQFTLTHLNPEMKNEYDYANTLYGSGSLRNPQ